MARPPSRQPGGQELWVLTPIMRFLQDFGKLRASAYDEMLKLPATDPVRKVMADTGHTW